MKIEERETKKTRQQVGVVEWYGVCVAHSNSLTPLFLSVSHSSFSLFLTPLFLSVSVS